MKKGWQEIEFKDLFNFESKSGLKAGEGLESGRYKFFTSSETQTKFINNYNYNKECLIFSSGGNPAIHYCNEPFSASNDCFIFSSDNKELSLKFVYYYFKKNMNILEKGFRGAGLKHLSKNYLIKTKIPIPPISVQHKIVEVLEKAEHTKQLREETNKLSDEYSKSVFYEMFLKNEFNIKNLEEVTIKITDGKHGDCENLTDSGYYFISAKDIYNGKIHYDDARQIKPEGYYEVNKRVNLELDDVLITNSGTIGKVAVMKDKQKIKKTTFQKSVAIIKTKKNLINSIYLKYILENSIKNIENVSSGSSQKNLLLKEIRKIKIPIPPLDLQEKFARIVEKVENIKKKQEESTKESEDLFNVLMQKAFKGELINV